MDRLRSYVGRRSRSEPLPAAYKPLIEDPQAGRDEEDDAGDDGTVGPSGRRYSSDSAPQDSQPDFSWLTYGVFCLLGVAMLWAWNMFLAATPYFRARFAGNERIQTNFLSAILLLSCLTNVSFVFVLARLQSNASYPRRISLSLLINIITFALLALSTQVFTHTSPGLYFAFVLATVLSSSWATGLCQNGVFAYASGFGNPKYMQAIMTGQAVAGVLPCIAQIVTVLSVPPATAAARSDVDDGGKPYKSAFLYFLASTSVCAIALAAFFYLLMRERHAQQGLKTPAAASSDAADGADPDVRRSVSMWTLFRKLRWLALAVFTCFGVTMVFPVFTKSIVSVRPPDVARPRIFEPAAFIPLGFLFWNAGDLLGRLVTLAAPAASWSPALLFALALLRTLFVPLYRLCNLHGAGAVVRSDAFYLGVVQLGFGASNGWLGSQCMMGAAQWVEADEREAAGAFMGLMLVAGLTAGSLLSFVVAGV